MKKKYIWWMFLFAVGAMLLCTKSSPLYPFNDWGDANIYFTMGKGMLQGQIPYRDLFDHKGPLIYAAYGLAALISQKSFLGVWVVEIVAAFFFLFYSYKILCMFSSEKAIFLMPVYTAIVYASNHMRHGGSAEELCLPFLIYGMYILSKWFVKKEAFTDKELIILGITSGCVLWTKYTMLGFYLGWIIVPAVLMIRKKEYKILFRTIGMIGIGVGLVTIPTLLYFGFHDALTDLFTVYFYNNIFVYTGEKVSIIEVFVRTFVNVLSVVKNNIFIFALIAVGALGLLVKKYYQMFAAYILCVGGIVLTVLTATTVHGYYSMCFSVFGVFGICAIWDMICKCGDKKISVELLTVISSVGMLLFMLLTGYNRDFILCKKEEMPQFQFAEIMNESEHPSLLNYGFLDGGFYTAAGIKPSCKYFFEANMNLEAMKNEQKNVIEKGTVEYVVTYDEKYNWSNYELIADADYVMEGNDVTYYLYKLK